MVNKRSITEEIVQHAPSDACKSPPSKRAKISDHTPLAQPSLLPPAVLRGSKRHGEESDNKNTPKRQKSDTNPSGNIMDRAVSALEAQLHGMAFAENKLLTKLIQSSKPSIEPSPNNLKLTRSKQATPISR